MANPDPRALAGAVAALRRVIANLRKTKAPKELLTEVERDQLAVPKLRPDAIVYLDRTWAVFDVSRLHEATHHDDDRRQSRADIH